MGYNLITESLLKGKDSHLNLQSKYQAETKWTKHLDSEGGSYSEIFFPQFLSMIFFKFFHWTSKNYELRLVSGS